MIDLVVRNRGLFVKLADSTSLEIAADADLGFVVIDLEHSRLGDTEVFAHTRLASALGLPALVRLVDVDRGFINRALEAGAVGFLLSSVESPTQVRALRSATRFPPDGIRSASLANAVARWGAESAEAYIATATAVVIAQIETAAGVAALDEILEAGPDALFVGELDLSVSNQGVDITTILEDVLRAGAEAGVLCGGSRQDPAYAFTVEDSDVGILAAGIRMHMTERTTGVDD